MAAVTDEVAVAWRPRAYVRVAGPQAADHLQRMVSNDVLALGHGGSCEALLLTAKARVIAPLLVLRRTDDDFLLLTEPELGDVVRGELLRTRFAARCEIELEEHRSLVALGPATAPEGSVALPCDDYGPGGLEILDAAVPPGAAALPDEELERRRIAAGTPRFGREIDDRVLPAEAGLVDRAVSFTKGCYPGQEPIARLRYRGHVNRELRVLRIDARELPAFDAEILHDGKPVGRVTSSAPDGGGVIALGYVRVEVPPDARLSVGGVVATMTPPSRP
jgi:folate-binding protein YgfZ